MALMKFDCSISPTDSSSVDMIFMDFEILTNQNRVISHQIKSHKTGRRCTNLIQHEKNRFSLANARKINEIDPADG